MFKIARKLKETTSHLAGFLIKANYVEKVHKMETSIEKINSHIKYKSLRYQLYDGKEPLPKYKVTINRSTGYIDGPEDSKITRFGYWEHKERFEESKNRNWKQIYHENVTALREINPTLPETVFLLEKPCGSKVFVIGTIHFSKQSIDDVLKVMNKTLPDCVILELCRYRSFSLLKDPKNMEKMQTKLYDHIKEIGFLNLLILFLLNRIKNGLNINDERYDDGEFKIAFDKANELSCCHVILGDQDVDITIKRALQPLDFRKRIIIIFMLLFGIPVIRHEKCDLEKCENYEECRKQMQMQAPSIYRAIVEERDLYLTKSIWDAVLPIDIEGEIPSINVAVVGIGHSPGIKKNWENAANINLLKFPQY